MKTDRSEELLQKLSDVATYLCPDDQLVIQAFIANHSNYENCDICGKSYTKQGLKRHRFSHQGVELKARDIWPNKKEHQAFTRRHNKV